MATIELARRQREDTDRLRLIMVAEGWLDLASQLEYRGENIRGAFLAGCNLPSVTPILAQATRRNLMNPSTRQAPVTPEEGEF